MLPLLHFAREYTRPGSRPVQREETSYEREGERLGASVYSPGGAGKRAGWVVLHGLTVPGRDHPSLERFARALAATGCIVMVPDIPEWRGLRVAAAITIPTIRAAIRRLAELPQVDAERVGLLGFSFGATQAIVAAADPSLDGVLRGLAAWGGYRDLQRLFRFGITGEHELDGVAYQLDPDPYGRWIMGSNYLTGIPGFEDYQDVSAALRELAMESGRRRVYAWDPSYDPMKQSLRTEIDRTHREVYDLFAPLAGRPVHDLPRAHEIARELANAALRAEPLLDPGPALAALRTRILVAHGRDDRLVPFTESLRLAREVPAPRLVRCSITALFAHSGGADKGLGGLGLARETARFLRLLQGIINLI
jgi:acetyl esterase/lipase